MFHEVKKHLFQQMEDLQTNTKHFENLGVTMSFKKHPGRKRPVDQKFMLEKLPLVLEEVIPFENKLTQNQYEQLSEQIVNKLHAKEFCGTLIPTFSIQTRLNKKVESRTYKKGFK